MDNRPATIICDIDGTLVRHDAPIKNTMEDKDLDILPGTIEKLLEWDSRGYNIILITGRRESMRKSTEIQLSKIGIIYDKLIMGIGGGKRYLINDRKPSGEDYAFVINLDRNEGVNNITI